MIYYLDLEGRPFTPHTPTTAQQLKYYLTTHHDSIRRLGEGEHPLLPPSSSRSVSVRVYSDGTASIQAHFFPLHQEAVIIMPPELHLPLDTRVVAIVDIAASNPLLYGIVFYLEHFTPEAVREVIQ